MSATSPEVTRPAAGTVAPDFVTRNQHGQPVRLSELRGAPVVVVFFPWAFSGICTGELRGLRDLGGDFAPSGARLLAVSTDPMFALRAFADAEGLPFDLLTDHWPHGEIAQAYGVFDQTAGCALRGSFLIDAEGMVRWSVVNQIGEARVLADHLVGLRSAA